jgi:hypothetical protein
MGFPAPATRSQSGAGIVTARFLIVAGLLLLGFDAADVQVTGLAVLAAVIIGAGLITDGVLTREYWIAPDRLHLDLMDADIDACAAQAHHTPAGDSFPTLTYPSVASPAGSSSDGRAGR